MAGDWIKMRLDLQTHPKVVRILSATASDKFRVIGGLHAVWSVFDTHSADGSLSGYTAETLDHIIGWPGFSSAMIAVGWLAEDTQGLVLPEFSEHNGKSGKRRAEDQKRKRDERKSPQSVRNLSANDADKKLTREEKRREELKPSPIPPEGGESVEQKRKTAISLRSFLADCRSSGATPIPDGHPVFAYADKVKLPRDFLALQWTEFKDRYQMPDAKRYKDWRTVFLKSVKGNWFKLWFVGTDGQYSLTTVGQQAQRSHREAA
jgi:hypothetical protein